MVGPGAPNETLGTDHPNGRELGMVVPHRNEGIDPLYRQLKIKYPGIVIGWIGNEAHQQRQSAHNPNAAGRVNAIDTMIGPAFTWTDAVWLCDILSYHADKRLNNIIFDHHIWDDANGKWNPYDGDDPHTNHCHIEVHDSAHTNTNYWNLTPKGQTLDMDETTLKRILAENNAEIIKTMRNTREELSDTQVYIIAEEVKNRVTKAIAALLPPVVK